VNILVVDDEVSVLESLRRVFSSFGSRTWNMTYVCSGDFALEALTVGDIDLIISDMRMPGMDGATLLTTAASRWPNVVRFALSAESNQTQAIRVADGVVHQFLGKPPAQDAVGRDRRDRAPLARRGGRRDSRDRQRGAAPAGVAPRVHGPPRRARGAIAA